LSSDYYNTIRHEGQTKFHVYLGLKESDIFYNLVIRCYR